MNNLIVYLIGTAVLIGGLAFGAHSLGVSTQWIVIGALVIAGIGIMTAVSKTRLKESSPDDGGDSKVVVQDSD